MPAAFFFFFNDTATTEIYTLSLHDALPIPGSRPCVKRLRPSVTRQTFPVRSPLPNRQPSTRDRKSTRLNSCHQIISYAVFCLKKKKIIKQARRCLIQKQTRQRP